MTLAEHKHIYGEPARRATLVLLRREGKVLLGLKKRGFAAGWWNGFGGKVQAEETIEQAAVRETEEESGVTPRALTLAATLDFYFAQQPDINQRVLAFTATDWTGTPKETEEMKPQWFKETELPYELMWPDDKFWLPRVLAGQTVEAEFLFGADSMILDQRITY